LAYNMWSVIGENGNSDAKIYGSAIDDDPTSDTYIYGTYGPQPAPPLRSKTVSNNTEAKQAAEAMKAANLGIAHSLAFGLVPNPALEPADVVSLKRAAVKIDEVALIDSLEIGLGADSKMTGEVRAKQELL
jgi:hypothetical protein